jgi:aminoglycoside phosphotransferase (APT) family kinase protein
MVDVPSSFSSLLASALSRRFGATTVSKLTRLTGGASQETFAVDAAGGLSGAFIWRRSPAQSPEDEWSRLAPRAEAAVIEAARGAGAPTPVVICVFDADEGLGDGFLMTRVRGEALGPRILRDPKFDVVRPRLAAECGRILAKLHAVPIVSLPPLPAPKIEAEIARWRSLLERLDDHRPVFALAMRWLLDHRPAPRPLTFVHGDFRLGNLLVSEARIEAVLDFELAHLGEPVEDLGWMCVPSWRFGNIDNPVGGFGAREDFLKAYLEAGGDVSAPSRLRYFEIFGALKWGVICAAAKEALRTGADRSIERAMIARRASEAEIDLLTYLDRPEDI